MLIASDLLAEVEEILAREKKDGVLVESVIERVLDRHNVQDEDERIRLSAEIGFEHINRVAQRARIAQADRLQEGQDKRERRMKILD